MVYCFTNGKVFVYSEFYRFGGFDRRSRFLEVRKLCFGFAFLVLFWVGVVSKFFVFLFL